MKNVTKHTTLKIFCCIFLNTFLAFKISKNNMGSNTQQFVKEIISDVVVVQKSLLR